MLSARRILFLSSLGGGFEMYDFVLYIYLTPLLSVLFFPEMDPFLSILNTFAVFAIGYLVRPLGGILFGHFGDRFGRKKTFVASMLLMSIPVLLIGLLPTHKSIGIAASILLVLLRILQGIAVGGEIPGAMTFTCEYVSRENRGLAGGSIYCGINCGIAGAALILALLNLILTQEQMLEFGWRIPFILGGFLGLLAGYLRNAASESSQFLDLQKKNLLLNLPIKILLEKHFTALLTGICITAMGSALVIVGFTYIKEYLTYNLHGNPNFTNWLTVLGVLFSALLQMFFGRASDIVGRFRLLTASTLLLIALVIPIFYLFEINLPWSSILAMLILAIVAGMVIGIYPTFLIELFPTEVRFSGYGLCYNLSFAVVGGLAPLIITYLIHKTDNLLIPAFYIALCSLLSLAGLLLYYFKRPKNN